MYKKKKKRKGNDTKQRFLQVLDVRTTLLHVTNLLKQNTGNIGESYLFIDNVLTLRSDYVIYLALRGLNFSIALSRTVITKSHGSIIVTA